MGRRLYRSRHDRMVSGVCGGIADHYEIDPTLVRLLAVVLTLVSFGTAVVVYVVMAIVVPEEPVADSEGSGPVMASAPPAPSPTPSGAIPPPGVPPAPPPPAGGPGPLPEHRPGRGGVTFGVVLVVLGLALLLSQFVPGLDLWRLWPLIIVAIGIRVMLRRRTAD